MCVIRKKLSWKVGFERGVKEQPFSCPWWADREVLTLAYIQGRGVKVRSVEPNSKGLSLTSFENGSGEERRET
jgi:hypothetical protein